MDQNCNPRGKCTCKENVIGDKCDQIVEAFYDITDPKECNCNVEGSQGDACDEEGRCTCRCNVKGDKCDECNSEYYGFPTCYGMF